MVPDGMHRDAKGNLRSRPDRVDPTPPGRRELGLPCTKA